MNTSRIVLALLVGLLSCAPALAQSSKMVDLVNNIRSHGEAMSDLYGRKPLDEAKIYSTASRMQEVCKSGVSVFVDFGAPLAAAASSPFEAQLREPAKQSSDMAYWIGREMVERCDRLMRLINTDQSSRGSSFEHELTSLMTGITVMARARSNDMEKLQKLCAETQKWLRESLQAVQNVRDNWAKTGASYDSSKRQLERWCESQAKEVQKCSETWRVAQEREWEASRRYQDAFKEYDAARSASPSSSYSSNVKSAWEKWCTAQRNHRDAGKVAHESLTNLENATKEARSRLTSLARFMGELEQFQGEANPETVSKRIYEFGEWIRLFERDMNR